MYGNTLSSLLDGHPILKLFSVTTLVQHFAWIIVQKSRAAKAIGDYTHNKSNPWIKYKAVKVSSNNNNKCNDELQQVCKLFFTPSSYAYYLGGRGPGERGEDEKNQNSIFFLLRFLCLCCPFPKIYELIFIEACHFCLILGVHKYVHMYLWDLMLGSGRRSGTERKGEFKANLKHGPVIFV